MNATNRFFSCHCQHILFLPNTTHKICNCCNCFVFRMLCIYIYISMIATVVDVRLEKLYSIFFTYSSVTKIISLNFIFVVLIRARQFHIIALRMKKKAKRTQSEHNSSSTVLSMKWNEMKPPHNLCLAHKKGGAQHGNEIKTSLWCY